MPMLWCWSGTSSILGSEWIDNLLMDVNLGVISSPLFQFSDFADLEWSDYSPLVSPNYSYELSPSDVLQTPIELPSVSEYAIDASRFDESTLTMDEQMHPQLLDFPPFPELYNLAETGCMPVEPSGVFSNAQAEDSVFDTSCLGLGDGMDGWHSTRIDQNIQVNSIANVSVPTTASLDWICSLMDPPLDLVEPQAYPSEAGTTSASAAESPASLENIELVGQSGVNYIASSKNITCEYCTKTFVRSSAYREHVNMHLGQKRESR